MKLPPALRRLLSRGVSVMPLQLLIGCAALRPAPTPIPHEWYVEEGGSHHTLLVLLPGIRDSPEDFARHGFIQSVRERGLDVDAVAVDSHLGYFRRQTLVERLRSDVLAPARARGYERIVAVGVSLGGLGSLILAQECRDDVDGLILLAPFLGEDKVIAEVAAAGGPRAWDPGQPEPGDFQRRLWAWLRSAELPPIVVGTGREDRLLRSSELLAELLPAGRLVTLPGGHDWRTWRELWQRLLEGSELAEAGVLPAAGR